VNSSTVIKFAETARAVRVQFTKYKLKVILCDGREISVPLEYFPRLRDASSAERNDWRLIGGGVGIHWESLDEDISVQGLINGN